MSSRKDNYFSILDTGNMFEDSGHRTRFKELLDCYGDFPFFSKGNAENRVQRTAIPTRPPMQPLTIFCFIFFLFSLSPKYNHATSLPVHKLYQVIICRKRGYNSNASLIASHMIWLICFT